MAAALTERGRRREQETEEQESGDRNRRREKVQDFKVKMALSWGEREPLVSYLVTKFVLVAEEETRGVQTTISEFWRISTCVGASTHSSNCAWRRGAELWPWCLKGAWAVALCEGTNTADRLTDLDKLKLRQRSQHTAYFWRWISNINTWSKSVLELPHRPSFLGWWWLRHVQEWCGCFGRVKTTQAVIQWQWQSWSSRGGQSRRPCQGFTGDCAFNAMLPFDIVGSCNRSTLLIVWPQNVEVQSVLPGLLACAVFAPTQQFLQEVCLKMSAFCCHVASIVVVLLMLEGF